MYWIGCHKRGMVFKSFTTSEKVMEELVEIKNEAQSRMY